nr:hypothetical protein Iba_chr02dCG3500 [Ipomoea batatas]
MAVQTHISVSADGLHPEISEPAYLSNCSLIFKHQIELQRTCKELESESNKLFNVANLAGVVQEPKEFLKCHQVWTTVAHPGLVVAEYEVPTPMDERLRGL